ncbi:helix-turn-helix transcriptional regulator [Thermomonospora cellulosilytica]|uniref:DNA-binding XRE family transcriptional regulator n=1 Tax=Thermomonospora cellulosilytica TaxID=1411118 RepID=A0A7W3MXH5_9ACTN|nr:helix-turn-helix transcriptional regulator [Thermomonospora cellulosilytica]MBA9003683.1 DNA-binding XRE family transcriptional regulator [Thermomonospora cellulosilytica]
MTPVPGPYAYLAALLETQLPALLKDERRRRGLSQRAAAHQIGVSYSTICRIENGHDCALSNAAAVLRWLEEQP